MYVIGGTKTEGDRVQELDYIDRYDVNTGQHLSLCYLIVFYSHRLRFVDLVEHAPGHLADRFISGCDLRHSRGDYHDVQRRGQSHDRI